jgi:hypothetical protein
MYLADYCQSKGLNRFDQIRHSIMSNVSSNSDSWDAYSMISSPNGMTSTGIFFVHCYLISSSNRMSSTGLIFFYYNFPLILFLTATLDGKINFDFYCFMLYGLILHCLLNCDFYCILHLS